MAKAKKLPPGSWRVNQFVGRDQTGKRIYKSFTAATKKDAYDDIMLHDYDMLMCFGKVIGVAEVI